MRADIGGQHPAAAHPRRIRLAVAGALAAAAIACAPLAAAPASAHDEILEQGFVLATDSTEVEAVKLSYSGNIMDVGTEIMVTDASGADVVDGAPEIDGRDVVQPIETPDADGSPYSVSWRVVSSDGHPIEGSYAFEVLPDGSAAVTEPGEGGADSGEADAAAEAEDGASEGAGDSADDTDDSAGALLPVLAAVGGVVVIALAATLIVRKARGQGAAPGAGNGDRTEEPGETEGQDGEDRA